MSDGHVVGAMGYQKSGLSQGAAALITVFGGITLAISIGGFYWLIRRCFCYCSHHNQQELQPANEGAPLAAAIPDFPQWSYSEATRELDYRDTNDCSICLERYEDADMVSVLPDCHHLYHTQCIRGWMVHGPRQQSSSAAATTCPICRITYRATAEAAAN